MNFQELLKAQNLTDEQIKAITDGMKENKIFTASEENLDIRYGKLKTDFDGLTQQHSQAQTLIEQLKKSSKGNEDLQGKITSYETQVTTLQEELKKTKTEAEAKVRLIEAGVKDIDYVLFKLKEKGELELDEHDKIKGWDDKIAGLKTQLPNQFETSGQKKIEERKLPGGNEGGALTRSDILKKPYNERMRIYNENPEAYNAAMKS